MKTLICQYGTYVHYRVCVDLCNGYCCANSEKCDATRYVRADVAMRYARMQNWIGYKDGYIHKDKDDCIAHDEQAIAERDAQRGKGEQ